MSCVLSQVAFRCRMGGGGGGGALVGLGGFLLFYLQHVADKATERPFSLHSATYLLINDAESNIFNVQRQKSVRVEYEYAILFCICIIRMCCVVCDTNTLHHNI
jgi:hypothetical protein